MVTRESLDAGNDKDPSMEHRYSISLSTKEMLDSTILGPRPIMPWWPPKRMWVGVAMTNVLKRLVPCGGLENFVGNNPFSVAVPVGKFPGVLDMANSVVAHHKIIS
jgi:hypothetical protein